MKKGIIIYNKSLSHIPAVKKVIDDLLARSRNLGLTLTPMGNTDFLLGEGVCLPEEKLDFIIYYNKDKYLGRELSKLNIPIFNHPRLVELCDNKADTYYALKGKVPMPKTIPAPIHYETFNPEESYLLRVEEVLSYPMILKEHYGSFGDQVYLVRDRTELYTACEKIGPRDFLFQEFIAHSASSDLRVLVVGDEVIGAMRRKNEDDFRANIAVGGQGQPVALTHEETNLALKAHRELGLAFSGVDLLFGEHGPIFCEVNTNLSYVAFGEVTGISMGDRILSHIRDNC